jgi:hypothetical protein
MLASGGRGEEQAGSGIGGAVPVPVIWLSKRQGGWRRRTPPPAVAAVARTESRLVVWLRKEVKQSDEGRPTPALQMFSCSLFLPFLFNEDSRNLYTVMIIYLYKYIYTYTLFI